MIRTKNKKPPSNGPPDAALRTKYASPRLRLVEVLCAHLELDQVLGQVLGQDAPEMIVAIITVLEQQGLLFKAMTGE